MTLKHGIAGILLGTVALLSTTASGENCLDSLTPKSGGEAFLGCLKEMQTKIEELGALRNLQTNSKAGVVPIPAGAVIAFDRPGGCPKPGWKDMGPAWRGRALVAGVRDANDTYGFGREGGAETHRLTDDEMPRHAHKFTFGTQGGSGAPVHPTYKRDGPYTGKSTTEVTFAGASKPHNNMPPYIALYFCKKEG